MYTDVTKQQIHTIIINISSNKIQSLRCYIRGIFFYFSTVNNLHGKGNRAVTSNEFYLLDIAANTTRKVLMNYSYRDVT